MDLLRIAIDLLLPPFCLACREALLDPRRRWLCVRCLARIQPLPPGPCPVCGGRRGLGAAADACRDCRRLGPVFSGTVAVGLYDELLKELVTRMKYGRDPRLAWPLGELLAGTVRIWYRAPEVEVVVPVPMRFGKRVRRGFDQAALLAGEVARRLELPLRHPLARVRGRGTSDQAGLSLSGRLVNQRSSMRVRDPAARRAGLLLKLPGPLRRAAGRRMTAGIRGRTVLLIDDVLTTGATVNEASRALLAAGARRVLVGVVARA